jgi:hydrogenase/urease accessory protein HupE
VIRRKSGFVFWSLLVIPGLAIAHTPIAGINNLYNGLLHPVFVPAHLLLLIALGLFIGQQGAKENQVAVTVFAGATVAGLIAAWFLTGGEMEVFLLICAAAIGILIAVNPVVGLLWCSAIAAVVGFSLGMDSAQEMLEGKERFLSLLGSGIAIYFLLLYPMGFANWFSKKTWQKTLVRVIGSWVAASSLMVLALSFSTGTWGM